MTSFEHPWAVSLEELLERVRGEYGEESADELEDLARLRGIADQDELEPEVIRSLAVRCGLPADDLSLDPD